MGDAHDAGRRVVFVQDGDYAEAASRFEGGGQENDFGLRYTFDFGQASRREAERSPLSKTRARSRARWRGYT